MKILEETLQCIKQKRILDTLYIKKIHLDDVFNVIELSTGEVGAAMNYYKYSNTEEKIYYNKYLTMLAQFDKLLLNNLLENSFLPDLIQVGLKNTLVNALSQELLTSKHEDCFDICNIDNLYEVLDRFKLNNQFIKHDDWVTVVGFGGILEALLEKSSFNNIYVSDLLYANGNRYFEEYVNEHNIHNKNVKLSNGFDIKEMIHKSKLISITGSALSNGTMEDLLELIEDSQIVIIQGESCSIYPEVLFNKYNVDMVFTTLKDSKVMWYLENDYGFFRNHLFENYLQEKIIVKKQEVYNGEC